MFEAVNTLIEQNATAVWVLPALFLLATFDAVLPPVPSESVVITLAAFGAATGSPLLLALGAVAALGAFLGDNLTFLLARRSGLRRLRESPRPRLRSAVLRGERELDRRGGLAIGALAGHWVHHNPLLGAVGGIALAGGLGLVVDRLLNRSPRRTPG